jgi:hypothetical protein
MPRKIVIEWSFEPADYFEEEVVVESDEYNLRIDDGHAQVTLDPKFVDEVDKLMETFSADLESRFLAVQLMTHEPFHLSKASRYDVKDDGTKHHYVKASITAKSSTGTVDLILLDADSNVVSDTKQDRIRKKRQFSEMAAKYGGLDKVLQQMLRSYGAAVSDPDNEFVHLYEIRDTAKKKFGNDSKTKAALNITKAEWNDFGRITCDEPLRQGRHRGQNIGSLRDATPQELERVRKIAAKIIENYMVYLDNQGT